MQIQHFFHADTSTLTYVVFDAATRTGVVIDPVLDFDPASGTIATTAAAQVAAFIDANGLRIPFVLETHAHADHLSALPFFRERYGAATGIGALISEVQSIFAGRFHLGPDFATDGSQFDRLLGDGDVLEAGPLRIEVLHTPGHTPACLSYRIGDALFVGDTLFMPDHGTARCDFPGGSAHALFASISRLYACDPATRVFVCHDYQPGGRELRFETTIGEQRRHNVQLSETTSEADFVAFRTARDSALTAPRLLLPSIQVNIRAGALPEPEANGVRYLKIPVRGNPVSTDDAR